MLNSILYCRKWQLPEEMRRQECWKWQLTHRAFLVSLLLWTTSLPSFCSLSLLLCDYQGSNFLDGQFTVENLCIPILEERKKNSNMPSKRQIAHHVFTQALPECCICSAFKWHFAPTWTLVVCSVVLFKIMHPNPQSTGSAEYLCRISNTGLHHRRECSFLELPVIKENGNI